VPEAGNPSHAPVQTVGAGQFLDTGAPPEKSDDKVWEVVVEFRKADAMEINNPQHIYGLPMRSQYQGSTGGLVMEKKLVGNTAWYLNSTLRMKRLERVSSAWDVFGMTTDR
jgi:hypothetical protein